MTALDQLIATTPSEERVNLLGLTRVQLEAFFLDLGEKRFRAQQVMKWIHHRGVLDFSDMTDLGVALRARLTDIAEITPPRIAEQQDSQDGTRKWAIAVEGGSLVEAVLIPEGDRATLCVVSGGLQSRLHILFYRQTGLPARSQRSRNYWSGLVGDQFLSGVAIRKRACRDKCGHDGHGRTLA